MGKFETRVVAIALTVLVFFLGWVSKPKKVEVKSVPSGCVWPVTPENIEWYATSLGYTLFKTQTFNLEKQLAYKEWEEKGYNTGYHKGYTKGYVDGANDR